MKILISAGPIPGKLDPVKIITNRFRGGLAIKTAQSLSRSHEIQLVAHTSTPIPQTGWEREPTILKIQDVNDYFETIQKTEADTYILAGAVANLVPAAPWKTKFPSHLYKPGDCFPIEFTIAPRTIDHVRQWHPNAHLIGYKLLDSPDRELIAAGKLTLREAKAHTVFCNHPAWAKERKIALTQDGAIIPMSFDDHIAFIEKIARLSWYKSTIEGTCPENPERETFTGLLDSLTTPEGSYLFGCVALRHQTGFFTTGRGKSTTDSQTFVHHVNHQSLTVHAAAKASLNAPTLAKMFEAHPDINWILHGHQKIRNAPTINYRFPGTTEETDAAHHRQFNIAHHGFYAGFPSAAEAKKWLADETNRTDLRPPKSEG